MIRRALTVVTCVLMLAGCSLLVRPIPAEPEPDATTEPIPAPVSAFDIACEDVVPIDQITGVFGDDMVSTLYTEAGAAGSWEMQATGLVQDGVLACAWAHPGSEPDPQVMILALDEAGGAFQRFQPSFLSGGFPYTAAEAGDQSVTMCRGDSTEDGNQCHWNVLSGDTWLSFFFQGVPDPQASAEQAAIVDAAIASISAAPRLPVERVTSTLAPCTDLTVADVADVMGLTASTLSLVSGRPDDSVLGSSTPKFGQVMWAYSYERLGYTECAYRDTDIRAVTMVAPGAAWILDARYAVQPPVRQISDLGRGVSNCQVDGAFTICTVAVAVGRDLVLAQLVPDVGADGEQQGQDLVRQLIGA